MRSYQQQNPRMFQQNLRLFLLWSPNAVISLQHQLPHLILPCHPLVLLHLVHPQVSLVPHYCDTWAGNSCRGLSWTFKLACWQGLLHQLCTFQHSNLNCILTHIRKHLNIMIRCPGYGKGYQNAASLCKHGREVHKIQIVASAEEHWIPMTCFLLLTPLLGETVTVWSLVCIMLE